jgi:sugar/nucleoside kinase (ribokinase family)
LLNRGADRAILTSVGTISALRVNDIPARLLDDVRHLHLAAYFLQTTARADLPTLFADVKKRGVTTSFDCNWDPNQDWTGIDDLLHHTDVFFLNEQEAMAITGHHDVLDAAKELLKRGPQVVAVHCGARGATVVSGDGDVHVDAPALDVVDTTGAGDSFNAGFLYAWIKGWDLEKTTRLAVACGSQSTLGAGGTASQPTLEVAMAAANLS